MTNNIEQHNEFLKQEFEVYCQYLIEVIHNMEHTGFIFKSTDSRSKNASLDVARLLLFGQEYEVLDADSKAYPKVLFTKVELESMLAEIVEAIDSPKPYDYTRQSVLQAIYGFNYFFELLLVTFQNLKKVGMSLYPLKEKNDIAIDSIELTKLFLFGLPYLFSKQIPEYRDIVTNSLLPSISDNMVANLYPLIHMNIY